ncbi:hypothetical protein FOA52_012836 [Chlamydomonas sp. UWO 241]|nr:hypothetical protein FOA52_012836 [Chlamydomonas sp. UWO 241]
MVHGNNCCVPLLLLLLGVLPSLASLGSTSPHALGSVGGGASANGIRRALVGASGRIAVVNDIAGHFEVLVSVVHVLRQIGVSPHIYYEGREDAPDSLGIKAWMGQDGPEPVWHPMRLLPPGAEEPAAVVMCISAEMAPAVCQERVAALKPSLLVLWVHRADTATATSKMLSLHSKLRLVALAPHVATLAQTRMKRPVTWDMPLAPYVSDAPCEELSCLRGFVVQGALRKYKSKVAAGFTRNYTALWEEMVAREPPAGTPRVQVCVLGKGGFRNQLGIPPAIDADVEYLTMLPYPEFWGRIYRSLALVPAFGMPVYLESRISSTITASLLTGTPLIADAQLMKVYSFLAPEHVFMKQSGENDVAAMYRILTLPLAEVMAKRRAVAALAARLNAQAATDFREMLREGGVTVS